MRPALEADRRLHPLNERGMQPFCMLPATPMGPVRCRTVMGGAMFTLADYAFAIASCIGQAPTVSVASTIEFLNAGTGNEMYAECTMDKMGRSMCYADVKVTDENDRVLAIVKMTGYRLK